MFPWAECLGVIPNGTILVDSGALGLNSFWEGCVLPLSPPVMHCSSIHVDTTQFQRGNIFHENLTRWTATQQKGLLSSLWRMNLKPRAQKVSLRSSTHVKILLPFKTCLQIAEGWVRMSRKQFILWINAKDLWTVSFMIKSRDFHKILIEKVISFKLTAFTQHIKHQGIVPECGLGLFYIPNSSSGVTVFS